MSILLFPAQLQDPLVLTCNPHRRSRKLVAELYHDHPGHHLRRYYWRGIVGCLGPFIIVVYYFLTWALYLDPPDSPNDLNFGRPGGQFIFYSWFVLAVVGLDIGEYGLVGVETSMLMKKFWAAPNASHIMRHGEHTWTGLGGWMSTLKAFVMKRNHTNAPTKLWVLLAVLTACLFIGLPLTGLTIQVSDGYLQSSNIPNMVGLQYDTFNLRDTFSTIAAAHNAWNLAIPPRVPGLGMLYINQSANKDDLQFSGLTTLPNVLPTDDGAYEIFLAPQADGPVTGIAWGLMVRYNCTVIDKLEDFTILSQRDGSVPLKIGGR